MPANTKKRAARSPNYPIQPLEWAVNNALELLEKEGLHAVPPDIVARNLGYKNANNGKAGRILANLKAFGVIEKATSGKLAVSQDVQRYKLTPTDSDKKSYLKQWLKTPLLYRKIMDKYENDLPSDAVLLFELVDEHGFNEDAAEKAIKVFRESINFYKRATNSFNLASENSEQAPEEDEYSTDASIEEQQITTQSSSTTTGVVHEQTKTVLPQTNTDNFRYPIRLAGGRIAWIEVPVPFYEVDKSKLKAQIEIIGTDDEDGDISM